MAVPHRYFGILTADLVLTAKVNVARVATLPLVARVPNKSFVSAKSVEVGDWSVTSNC